MGYIPRGNKAWRCSCANIGQSQSLINRQKLTLPERRAAGCNGLEACAPRGQHVPIVYSAFRILWTTKQRNFGIYVENPLLNLVYIIDRAIS
ncbi:unnamed protein product [Pieris brassicae]|uniref:Uncharacterized protein n=1 Tax=Pieris brassicae TaxID=7116 RepID=A0A9P0TYP9_PIEBR|nr:unnamed protein product [Pieris brassicae]